MKLNYNKEIFGIVICIVNKLVHGMRTQKKTREIFAYRQKKNKRYLLLY